MNEIKDKTRTLSSQEYGVASRRGLAPLNWFQSSSLEHGLSRIARTRIEGGSTQFFSLKTELLCMLRDLRHDLLSKGSIKSSQKQASSSKYTWKQIHSFKKEQSEIIYRIDDLLSTASGLMDMDLSTWDKIQTRLSELIADVQIMGARRSSNASSIPSTAKPMECERHGEARAAENALQQKGEADALFHDGRLVEAESHYRLALDFEPANVDILYGLGLNLYYQSRLSEALVYLLEVVERAPRYSVAYYRLGLTYHHLGQLDKAAESFQRCLALTPEYKMAHYHLGVVYARAGKIDQAIAEFSGQLDENLKDVATRRHLVDLLITKRKKEGAEAEYECEDHQ
ncbi:tetratricopeptide repeat protein [bacterium]|nr:tetratricopeptide repeat protein [bacterium]